MKTSLFVLALAFSLLTEASPLLSRQWTRSTLSGPHLQFRYLNRMAPILTQSMVIQGNAVDGIKAFNRKTGHEIWGLKFKNGVEGGAVLDGNKLYFGANNGQFYCVNVNSGAILWSFKLHSESLTRPLVQGAFVYHVTGNNTLYSFDKNTGQSLWVKTNAAKSNMTVRGQTAPIYEKGILYLGFSDGVFAAINAQNGRELWSKRIGDDKKFNDVDARAVISTSCILVASYANSLYCLNKNSGGIRWRHDVGGYNAVYLDTDKVYYPTVNNEIHLLDEASGKLIKKVVKIKGLSTEITGLGSYIVYGESEGRLIVRHKNSLDKVLEFSPGLGIFARPTVDEKTRQIYFVSNDANLYRLDLKKRKENPFLWAEENQ